MKSSAPIYREVRQGKKRKTIRWVVDFRYLGGTKERFATENQAKGARDLKLAEIHQHGQSALHLSHNDRVDFMRARDRLSQINLTIMQAVEFCERHHAAVKEKNLAEAIDELHRVKIATNKRERSANNFKYTLEGLRASIGEKIVSKITREEIEQWLFGNGWAPATIRTKLIDVRTFFNAGLKRGWITADPTAAIESIELDEKPPVILTVGQAGALLAAAREVEPGLTCYVALALFCGIRPEEIQRMQAVDVALERGHAEVRAEISKTRQRRLVEIPENCKAWLTLGLDLPPANVQHRMNRVRLRAGFEGYRRFRRDGREVREIVPGTPWAQDVLRHSFASYHVAMHGSADKTATQMGHRSTAMLFRHYRELVTKGEAEEFWRIVP